MSAPRPGATCERSAAFRIDAWDDSGNRDCRAYCGGGGNFYVAHLAYAVKRRPAARIILRQVARVVKDAGQRQ